MRRVGYVTFVSVVMATEVLAAGIGDSLEIFKKDYGGVVNMIKDNHALFPQSYTFRKRDAEITARPFPNVTGAPVLEISVDLLREPTETPDVLLERYSGIQHWVDRPLSDGEFARRFPLMSGCAPEKCQFYVSKGAIAMVLRIGGKFVNRSVTIQTTEYPKILEDYRRKNK